MPSWSVSCAADCASDVPPGQLKGGLHKSGLSGHQAQSVAVCTDVRRVEPAARYRDHDDWHYRGALDDALRLAQATSPDLWIVEAGTNGPFAEASRIPGDTRKMIARIYGVERAGAVTYQSVQTEIGDRPLRLFVVGFQLGRLGAPRKLLAGRHIMRSHFEMVVDRSAGLALGTEVPIGTHGHKFTVVGLTRDQLTSAETRSLTSRCSMRATPIRTSPSNPASGNGARRSTGKH